MSETRVHSTTDGPHETSWSGDPLAQYRELFPILAHTNYLISNSLGAVPSATASSLQSYYEDWAMLGVRAWEDSWWTLVSDLGDLVAPLIGAGKGEVIFQPNVTLSHAVVFSAARFSGPRNKIVTDAMHFPSILYLIDEQRKYAALVDVVPSRDGITVDTDELLDHIDERTAIVNVSHVLFKSAYIHEVAAITAKARRVGALTVIDGYQAVGTIPVDVRALGIDVYIGGCLKWLCGGPGAAFLWVDPATRGRLEPALTGWMAHQRPFSFERAHDRRTDGWRLLHGTPNIPALYAAKPGLKLIDQVGIHVIRQKSQRQTGRLLDLADREGYPCTTPRDPARRGGTVAINVENANEICQSLKALDIMCDYRPGAGIRFSPHFYNLDSELDAAVAAIREIQLNRRLAGVHGPEFGRNMIGGDVVHRDARALTNRRSLGEMEWAIVFVEGRNPNETPDPGVDALAVYHRVPRCDQPPAGSYLVPRSESFLSLGHRFFALLRPGWIDLASGLDTDPGDPAPLVVNPRNIVFPKPTRSGSVNLPGFSLTFCLLRTNTAIWSARISLFVPLVLSLFMIAIVFYRLKRLEGRAAASPTANVASQASWIAFDPRGA